MFFLIAFSTKFNLGKMKVKLTSINQQLTENSKVKTRKYLFFIIKNKNLRSTNNDENVTISCRQNPETGWQQRFRNLTTDVTIECTFYKSDVEDRQICSVADLQYSIQ
jgi:hypothetical protein